MRQTVKLLSSLPLSRILEKSAKYQKMSEEYLNNAMIYASKLNFAKATEFLWGAIAEAVKSIYALDDRTLGEHRQIMKALEELVLKKELADGARLIQSIDQLHINFYEGFVDEGRFLLLSKDAYKLITELFKALEVLKKQKEKSFRARAT